SEQMAKAVTESYRSTSGNQWYYWCQRNGRGNLEGARELALRWAALPHTEWGALTQLGAIYQSEGDPERAMEYFKRAAKARPTYGGMLSVAQLAGDERNREELESYLAKKEELVKKEDPEAKDPVTPAGLALIELMRSEEFEEEQFQQVE